MHNARVLVGLVALLACTSMATADLIDNFDSYADQAAFNAAWPSVYAGSSMNLLQGYDHTTGSTNSVNGVVSANYTMRNYRDMPPLAATNANPVTFSFWVQLGDPNNTGARNYCELRAYSGGGYGQGALVGLIAMGVYNAAVPTTNWSVRTLTDNGAGGMTGESWKATNIARAAGWHELKAVIGDTTINYYVDGVLAWTAPATPTTWTTVVLGSGLTSNGMDAAFDDLSVTPEPATLAMLALGSGVLFVRRRRLA